MYERYEKSQSILKRRETQNQVGWRRMKDIMTHYYIDAKTADQTGKKVAWITSGASGGATHRHGCDPGNTRKITGP